MYKGPFVQPFSYQFVKCDWIISRHVSQIQHENYTGSQPTLGKRICRHSMPTMCTLFLQLSSHDDQRTRLVLCVFQLFFRGSWKDGIRRVRWICGAEKDPRLLRGWRGSSWGDCFFCILSRLDTFGVEIIALESIFNHWIIDFQCLAQMAKICLRVRAHSKLDSDGPFRTPSDCAALNGMHADRVCTTIYRSVNILRSRLTFYLDMCMKVAALPDIICNIFDKIDMITIFIM